MSKKKSVTLVDFYEQYPNKKVDWATYRQVLKTFNFVLMKTLIETGDIYKLPKRLGTLSIRKFKGGGNRFKMSHYKATGEKIFFKNKHSDGYYARFHWEKNDSYMVLATSIFWKYRAARYHTRALAQHIFKNSIHKYYD